jgi:hypothetical protein
LTLKSQYNSRQNVNVSQWAVPLVPVALLDGTGTVCSPTCTRVRFWNRLYSLQARCLAIGYQFLRFQVKAFFLYLCFVIFLLNTSLTFQSTIPVVDEVLVGMTNIDLVHRLDALNRLGTVICSMSPESLLIEQKEQKIVGV